MTDMSNNLGSCVMVAIDVAKLSHEVLIEFPDGKHKKLKVRNSRKGFTELYELLKPFPKIVAGLEPSGNYHRNLAHFLIQNKIELKCISSIVAARTREALHNSWDKNDPKDAQVILYLMKQKLTQIYYDAFTEKSLNIQELASKHFQITLKRTELRHSIVNHYFAIYFPEAEKFWCANRGEWFSRLICRFPTPFEVQKLSIEEFLVIAMPLLRGRPMKESLLRDFYLSAKESIGVATDEQSEMVALFKEDIVEMDQLLERIIRIEEKADELLKNRMDYKVLRSLPGIGPVVALNVIAEAGDLKRFKHEKQFLKFCGFDLSTSQSGQYKGKSRISKRGNRRLRSVFWQAAKTAVHMRQNTFQQKFANYVSRDKLNKDLRRKAYTATAIKMARVAYALVVKEKYYRPLAMEVGQLE